MNTPVPAETLPEIREVDAPAEVAAIYHDFRASSGNPQINLIYRHLATMPGVLVWAWDVLRPLYRSERLGKAIVRVIDAVEGDGRGFVAESLAPAEAAAVRNLLTAYNFGNAQNLIALKSLVLVLQGDIAVRAAPEAPARFAAPIAAAVPPLPRLADLEAGQAVLVKKMSAAHGASTAGLVPSMYLHLTLWPAALRRAAERVPALMKGPDRARKLRLIDEIASAEAAVLATDLSTGLPRLPRDVERRAIAAVEAFVSTVIPEMTLVGCTLLGDGRTR